MFTRSNEAECEDAIERAHLPDTANGCARVCSAHTHTRRTHQLAQSWPFFESTNIYAIERANIGTRPFQCHHFLIAASRITCECCQWWERRAAACVVHNNIVLMATTAIVPHLSHLFSGRNGGAQSMKSGDRESTMQLNNLLIKLRNQIFIWMFCVRMSRILWHVRGHRRWQTFTDEQVESTARTPSELCMIWIILGIWLIFESASNYSVRVHWGSIHFAYHGPEWMAYWITPLIQMILLTPCNMGACCLHARTHTHTISSHIMFALHRITPNIIIYGW